MCSDCSLPASCKVVAVLVVVVMSLIFLVSLLGNLATIITIRSDSHYSSYQHLQISLCCADLLLSLRTPQLRHCQPPLPNTTPPARPLHG